MNAFDLLSFCAPFLILLLLIFNLIDTKTAIKTFLLFSLCFLLSIVINDFYSVVITVALYSVINMFSLINKLRADKTCSLKGIIHFAENNDIMVVVDGKLYNTVCLCDDVDDAEIVSVERIEGNRAYIAKLYKN